VVSAALREQLQVVVAADEIGGNSGRIRSRFLFVAGGDWDCEVRPLSQTRAWRIMASIHALEGNWQRSPELKPMVERVRQGYRGGRDYPMSNRRDVEHYFASRAELWQRCREQGLRQHPRSPIRFALGRSGVYLKTRDGAHRLCCAMLLGQSRIPGQIWQIHPDYLEVFVQTRLAIPEDKQ
jgi:hypothetical protein